MKSWIPKYLAEKCSSAEIYLKKQTCKYKRVGKKRNLLKRAELQTFYTFLVEIPKFSGNFPELFIYLFLLFIYYRF